MNSLLRLKTDVLEQIRNVLKNDLKALADNQKEYLKLYSKIRYCVCSLIIYDLKSL